MSDRVIRFRELHASGFFVLPCAWDAPSARLVAALPGVRAIGTSSAAVAATQGVADGEIVSREAMIRAVAGIVATTDLPVSADLEGGYGDVRRTVKAAIEVGVAGVNLEDNRYPGTGLRDIEEAADRIAAARQAADDAGVPIVINARTDTWWSGSSRFDEGADRLRRYLEAGADCLFAPGLPWDAITALLAELPGSALNLLAGPDSPSFTELESLGVRRVSTGSALARLAWGSARDAMAGLLGGSPLTPTLSYQELNGIMTD